MDDSTRLVIIAVVMVGTALVSAPRVHRETLHREPVYSGPLAQTLNFVAAFAFGALVPGVLTTIILGRLHWVPALALGMLGIALVAMLLFAVIELPASKRNAPPVTEDEDLWTAEKARTSGL